MKTNINTAGLVLTPAIENYLAEKLAHVERFLDSSDEAVRIEVWLGQTTPRHKHGEVFKAEMNLHLTGRTLHGSVLSEDLYAAIDLLQDEIVSEIKRWHGKRHTLLRRGGRKIKNMLHSINPWKKS